MEYASYYYYSSLAPLSPSDPYTSTDYYAHNLLACYQFFGEAVRLMTDPEQITCPEDWHLGLFLNQQWLREQGDVLMQELINTKQQLNH